MSGTAQLLLAQLFKAHAHQRYVIVFRNGTPSLGQIVAVQGKHNNVRYHIILNVCCSDFNPATDVWCPIDSLTSTNQTTYSL